MKSESTKCEHFICTILFMLKNILRTKTSGPRAIRIQKIVFLQGG